VAPPILLPPRYNAPRGPAGPPARPESPRCAPLPAIAKGRGRPAACRPAFIGLARRGGDVLQRRRPGHGCGPHAGPPWAPAPTSPCQTARRCHGARRAATILPRKNHPAFGRAGPVGSGDRPNLAGAASFVKPVLVLWGGICFGQLPLPAGVWPSHEGSHRLVPPQCHAVADEPVPGRASQRHGEF